MLVQRERIERLRAGSRLLGPAFVAAVAYVDPGNVATNTAAGATYGYLLLWVLVAATLMAGLVQYLSAKVGWLTGRSLPALVAERRRNREVVRDRILRGRDAGDMPGSTDVEALADLVDVVIAGMSSRARDGATRGQLDAMVDQLMAGWPAG